MPRIGTAAKDRDCLVCGGKTNVAHMGLDVCRACTVFYRRSVGKRVYSCRSISNACIIGPDGVNCRKCRFDHIERVLTQSGSLNREKSGESSDETPENGPSTSAEIDHQRISPVHSSNNRPVLTRLNAAYKTMSEIRFISELNLRADPPHPMQMKSRRNQFYQATFGSMNSANRIFLSAVLPFAAASFPEFDTLAEEDQWAIVMNFFFRFRPFESTYRADNAFPEHLDRSLGGYTCYISGEGAEHFLSDCPTVTPANIEDVKRLMWDMSKTAFVKNRTFMARLKPSHEEFIAITGIMFCTLEGQDVSDEAQLLGERYRSEILQELHVYYREELHIEDYAPRLGELLNLIQMFEKCDDMKDTFFEVLRLMNVLTEDSFSYNLIK